jgi:hypothetical protein
MKPTPRILIPLLILLFAFPAVGAVAKNAGHIAGKITGLSGRPIRDVIIRIIQEIDGEKAITVARSDTGGSFRSASLMPGTYFLQVSHQGYESVETPKFEVDPGRSVSLDIMLQQFLGVISKDGDPRNWDLETVMRSTSDRRLIFRNMPGDESLSARENREAPFRRSGAMNIASGSPLMGANFVAQPQASQNGVSSAFAYTEPISERSRMIFTGQLDYGSGSFWRVRDTFNYRPDEDHDYRVSVGYGRMNTYYPGSDSINPQMLSEESGVPEIGVRTLAVGMEGTARFLDLLAITYGFDYSRLYYGASKSLFYPSVQILLTPLDGWSFQTSFTSRRMRDLNSVVLPDGEILNLSEPTLITMVGNQVSMSQIRHSEVAAERAITPDTAVEVAVFQDRTQGSGLPLMITAVTQSGQASHVIEMNEDLFNQRGMRITLQQKILDCLKGSLAYVYGDAIDISDIEGSISSPELDETLASYMLQSTQHSITGRLNAIIPVTKTNVLATVRWYPGNALTPVDWFSDRMDIGTKSTNFEIRQTIPLPEFLGTSGQWEVMLNMRNVLNQGREHLRAKDGEIVLNRNPRSLRFGVNLSFH